MHLPIYASRLKRTVAQEFNTKFGRLFVRMRAVRGRLKAQKLGDETHVVPARLEAAVDPAQRRCNALLPSLIGATMTTKHK